VVDLTAHRGQRVVSVREAGAWSATWLAVGLAFGGVVWWAYGSHAAGGYLAGFLVEKSLSVDNVVVFAVVLASLGVPREHQHRILWFGVVGALVLRAVFVAGGAALLDRVHAVVYVFGTFLVVTGVTMFRRRHQHDDPERNRVLRLVRRVVPSVPTLHGRRLWVRSGVGWRATPLFLAIVAVSVADVVFAVDSIPAVFAITREPFLVLTSNAFAVLGLRALYFLLDDLVDRFVHLRTGLAVILVLVGLKMLLSDVVTVPVVGSLATIALCLGVAVLASLRTTRAPAPAEVRAPVAPAPTDVPRRTP
jgi:tellurite resistance protein TerC